MHLKLWHSDGAAAYLGSANADWKSLAQVRLKLRLIGPGLYPREPHARTKGSRVAVAQVKELGVLINSTSQRVQRGAPSATSDLGRVYDAFWEWAEPRVAPTSTSYYSPSFLTILRLPPWDKNVPMGECNQTLAPFDMSAHGHLAALSSVDRQQRLCTVSGASSSSAFVSASPGDSQNSARRQRVTVPRCILTERSLQADLRSGICHRWCTRFWPHLRPRRSHLHHLLRQAYAVHECDGLFACERLFGWAWRCPRVLACSHKCSTYRRLHTPRQSADSGESMEPHRRIYIARHEAFCWWAGSVLQRRAVLRGFTGDPPV